MPANFYPGQTDYLRQLNELARAQDIVDIPLNVAAAAASVVAAQQSATSAKSDAANASASMAATASAFASFDARYLGAKSTVPDKDNHGAPLFEGAIYWDTSLNGGCLRVFQGSAWVTVPVNVASEVRSTPVGGIVATNVQAALTELDAKKAATASLARVATSGAKADVGLGNVDNTSDANKPLSSAHSGALALKANTQDVNTALALKANLSELNSALAAKADSRSTGMKNRIINGDMRIAQRALFGPVAAGGYTVDRWWMGATGAQIGWGQVKTSVPAMNEYALTALGWAGEAGNTGLMVMQRIESANCADLAGSNVTVSFWMYQNTGSTRFVTPALVYSDGAADAWPSQTGIPALDPATSVQSGVWTKVTNRFAVPIAATTGLCIYPWSTAIPFLAGQIGRLVNVQLEPSDVATPFDRQPLAYQLGLCQYYYRKDTYGHNVVVGTGQAHTTGTAYIHVPMTGAMRVPPTIFVSGGLARLGGEIVGWPTAMGYGPSGFFFYVAWSSTPFISGNAVLLAATGSFTIIRDAEL